MRVYLEHSGSHFLVDNIVEIFLSRYEEEWSVNLKASNDTRASLVHGVDGATAKHARDELLRLTSDEGVGVAVISWDGTQFTRRPLL
ncbi:hypothetical protein M1D93_13130 [Arthrobacter sp. Z1-9]